MVVCVCVRLLYDVVHNLISFVRIKNSFLNHPTPHTRYADKNMEKIVFHITKHRECFDEGKDEK